MRLTVDQGRCCGAGQCVLLAPSVFGQRDEDGTVLLLDAQPPPELLGAVRSAMNRCPSGAIGIEESGS